MRGKLIVLFTLFFLLSIMLINNNYNTYAFEDCTYKKIDLKDVSTINIEDYLKKNNYELVEMCSFDVCYVRREESIKVTIDNFKEIFNKYLQEDEYLELNVKGYPVTRIYVNNC